MILKELPSFTILYQRRYKYFLSKFEFFPKTTLSRGLLGKKSTSKAFSGTIELDKEEAIRTNASM